MLGNDAEAIGRKAAIRKKPSRPILFDDTIGCAQELPNQRQESVWLERTSPIRRICSTDIVGQALPGQPLPPFQRISRSRIPTPRRIHEAACLLPAPRPPGNEAALDQQLGGRYRRYRPYAASQGWLRMPGLWRARILHQGALDGPLREAPRGV